MKPPGSDRPFPPPDWEDAEDLEVELRIAAASLAAIKRRFSRCDADLAHALLTEIEAHQLDAHALLGIDGSVDFDDEADSGALSQDQVERLFKGLQVTAALATPRSLETVMRYETHLSREFARTLSQLVQRQGTRWVMLAQRFLRNEPIPVSRTCGDWVFCQPRENS